MKNAFILLVVAITTIFIASCTKCHVCHNQCEVCSKARHDTTLTILIESQTLGQEYYTAYIDSLQSASLGWVCHDTASNYAEQVCENSKSNGQVLNEEAKGMVCN